MSNVVGNPEELERFARNLKEFNKQLRESMSRLQGQFARLGDTWRDQEHQKFAQELSVRWEEFIKRPENQNGN